MQYSLKEEGKFRYVEEGEGEPLVLLHGLFGAMSNFQGLIEHFRHSHKVVVPILPLFDLDILHTSVGGLAKYVINSLKPKGIIVFICLVIHLAVMWAGTCFKASGKN